MPIPSLDRSTDPPVVLPIQVGEDPVLVLKPPVDFRQGRGGGRRGRGGGRLIVFLACLCVCVGGGWGRVGFKEEKGKI